MNSHDHDQRRRGRPREVADGVRVCVRIPPHEYDRLDRLARARGQSVPRIIRKAISALNNPTLAQPS
jgi:hypothetical protein